ncbi:unnamed protein product [Bursaphelenchus okinawaensis]|uniref:Uncharacterized protein n=1 Tax=Bursaphelenchus okinawaensis TaxID=465554 RepID=A0A811LI52_9BILA|nr:unnamed protein product [Bursaphelenchus okinawaensis]CAG9126151.1 unnamed protein product [Bursaphelenchus okinawaensis]
MTSLIFEADSSLTDDENEGNFTTSSCSISLKSSSTTGISSMDTNSMRFVNSNGTLDEFFGDREQNDDEEDEGRGSGSDNEDLDVQVTITIDEKIKFKFSEKAGETEIETVQSEADELVEKMQTLETPDLLAPLKYYLRPVCTIGTGTFGRVSLTRHNVTGHYYALKALYIPSIIDRRQVQHVHNEKRILTKLDHPFVVKLYDTAKDTRNLYMIMEFLAGGELFAYLRATKVFSSSMVKFYAAEVILALEYLHGLNIAYRDLKPENLMMTQEGHVKLTDFGFAKEIHNKSYTLCGTAEYLAPELANRSGHNRCVDYWALGVLIFELMAGYTPYPGDDADDVQMRIVEQEGVPEFPKKTFSVNAKDIVTRLLAVTMTDRLGYNGTYEIKQHAWFETVEWDKMLDVAMKPPLQPTVYHAGDTGNFDTYAEEETRAPAKQRDLDLFDEW